MPLITKHCKAETQVGHPEQGTQGYLALGWLSVRASRQGCGLVCIWLINLLGIAGKIPLEILTQYFTEIYLPYSAFQVGSQTIILIMGNAWHFVSGNKAGYSGGMDTQSLLCCVPIFSLGHVSVYTSCSEKAPLHVLLSGHCDPWLDQGIRSGYAHVHSSIIPDKHRVFLAPRLVRSRIGTDCECSAVRYRGLQTP